MNASSPAPVRPPARRPLARPLQVAMLLLLMITALATPVASGSPSPDGPAGGQVTLLTHDSFALPQELLASFEQRHGVELRVLREGDAGSMLNQAILTAGAPLADVLYGVDSTFLSRALEADIFEPYRSPELASVDPALLLDPEARVSPIDVGDVCLNLDGAAFGPGGLPRPERLEDLLWPELRGRLVVENPAISSPGLAFLLATVARFGEDPSTGWRPFWAALRDNDVLVAANWEEAYYGQFSGGTGEGDRPIVVSYATSPAAEVVYGGFASPPPEAPTAVVEDGCFRQVEYAGVLAGTTRPDIARSLVDFLLSPEVQAAIPLSMFVYPARVGTPLPPEFERYAVVPSAPLSLDPAVIEASRERWIDEWTETVLR